MTMITETSKLCNSCGLVKGVSEYHMRGGKYPNTPKSRCKACISVYDKTQATPEKLEATKLRNRFYRAVDPEGTALAAREYNLNLKYGISLDTYDEMHNSQHGACAICCKPEIENKLLCVDHNHDTGEVRGLLCQRCNKGIGLLGDDPAIAMSAAKYLLVQGNYSK